MSSEKEADCFRRTKEFLEHTAARIRGAVVLAHSYQAEDTVALDILLKLKMPELLVFTLDTGRLFPELEPYHRELEEFFGIKISRIVPDADEERELLRAQGEFGMKDSLEARRLCCRIRKIKPLARFLQGKSAWVTGLRASQSVTRYGMRALEYDEQFRLLKFNPLVDWNEGDVNRYIEERGLPRNPLYAKGFRSIGCAPCTRPVKAGEDIRAGRWWWENPEYRECGCMTNGRREREQYAGTIKLG
ncbi:MAG: phosphoadenylyl-sulfate reductase [Spirochaetaceae bacterium]|jgi:phosphoadenosine phosphosulfate reductase|nr:phosphoadenylyl-sulfate reductase [Spirochaetaceae bacterium]